MKFIWSACTIVIGAFVTPHIDASTFKHKSAEGMRKKMLRNERALSGQSRIVGGQDADIGKYPFFVEWEGCGASLVHKGKFSSSNFCQQSFKKEPQAANRPVGLRPPCQ
jgi:hypothetical protein